MPLVASGAREAHVDEAGTRARKLDPRYRDGPLVRVAGGRNQAEAELIQNILLEEGVPSMLRRSAGFDVPDFLAAGPRDVLVPESGAEAALEALSGTQLLPTEAPPAPPRGLAVAAAVLAGTLAAAALAWALLSAIPA